MEKLILNTKGEIKYRIIFILTGIFFIALGIFAFSIAVEAPTDETKSMGSVLCGVTIAASFIAILYSFIHCSGYIEIHSYHCEGKGIQGKGIKKFYLSNRQIRSVTSESYFLCLHTEIGEFKIICSQKYHMQAMAFFTNNPMR